MLLFRGEQEIRCLAEAPYFLGIVLFGKKKSGCCFRHPDWFLPLIADKRQQSDMTRSLDGFRQLSLMFCTCARHSAGQDLCAL